MKSMLVLLMLSVLTLAGCNTVHGFGQDVQKLGEKIDGK
ncbi:MULTISPECIES: entericidin A/B family lipoprotein [Silvimonas]|nr:MULTISPECIES: entericidin A/B family lipoprotein [Silvimonas]MDR3428495.1 entericidin A/B family lipoprotein [Silvimonas sp.]